MLKYGLLLAVYCYSYLGLFSQQNLFLKDCINKISKDSIYSYVSVLASDKMEGRETGEQGQKRAANYIAQKFRNLRLDSFENGYLQKFSYKAGFNKKVLKNIAGENVIGLLKGKGKNPKTLVITAHYDHLGIKDSLIYNGADDNASGTAAIIEMARIFTNAVKGGAIFENNILFIAFSGEEKGLLGSLYYVKHPVIPIKKSITNINIDMIGRVDQKYSTNVNYIYIIGSDKITQNLKDLNNKQQALFSGLVLDYFYDTKDKFRYYFRSDHYNFAKRKVPIAFYFNGVHGDYHKPTDDIEKINFELAEKRTKFILSVAWELAQTKKLK